MGLLKPNDRVIVLAEDEYEGLTGTFIEVTQDGRVVVELDGTGWKIPFDPHDLELADERE